MRRTAQLPLVTAVVTTLWVVAGGVQGTLGPMLDLPGGGDLLAIIELVLALLALALAGATAMLIGGDPAVAPATRRLAGVALTATVGAFVAMALLPAWGLALLPAAAIESLLAMIAIAGFAMLAYATSPAPGDSGTSDDVLPRLARLAGLSMLIAISSGAVVGVDGAALPCTSWPLCAGGELFPAELTLAGALHMGHRVAAAVAAIMVAAILVRVWTRPAPAVIRQTATVLAALMLSQVLLGGNVVIARSSEALGLLHLVAAVAGWLMTVRLLWVARPAMVAAGETEALAVTGPRRTQGQAAGDPSGVTAMASSAAGAAALPAPGTDLVAPVTLPDVSRLRQLVRDYVALMKPGILSLLLFTTFTAMLIAAAGFPSFWLICVAMVGGTLAAGGANVLNCYIDRDIDAQMHRTRHRATAANRVPPSHVLVFGISLTVFAVLLLGFGANWLSAWLALAGNLFYVFIYTAWLKRRTPQNIVIGGAAGAVPPLVGWAAVTGNLSIVPWLLFAVIFMWTPPHFWALALLKQGEYGRALVPMLPVVAGEETTRRQILIYSVLLFAVCLALVPAGLGWIYLVVTVVVNAVFLGAAVLLYVKPTKQHARQLFFLSLWYLVAIFGAGVIDRVILG